MNNSKTKIICTLGPKSDSKTELIHLIQAGMDVARLNMSHGTYDTHIKLIKNLKKAEKQLKHKIDILVDLQGPKIRTCKLPERGITIKRGQIVTLTTDKCFISPSPDKSNFKGADNMTYIPVQYYKLPEEINIGDPILIDDGFIELKTLSKTHNEITCKVIAGGKITSNKGINVPNTKISLKSLTPKDKQDLEFAIPYKPKYIAMSFVRTAKDILDLRKLINKLSQLSALKSQFSIVAKIETAEAIKNLDSIAQASDILMVARGDLAVEVGFEKVPTLQKKIIEAGHKYNKPVIVATQMLASMVSSPVPTRAELSDIALAVWENADMVMLSNETSVGKYPCKVVQVMEKVMKELL